ncbi:DUF948 domain-containing protein [Kocuria coralli]|uniref:DUF948 domain-containing protein n=1 Tax=Kocuria coralli TaxID=1461025 RepID=A0A5J5L0D8_9MICC|nr:DUF948 domain-containing protein [Kocuria coralli]
MTGGDIAGLIAAGVFAVLVALLAVPIIKLGRVFDELRVWIRDLNDETEPLIDEVVRTVATTNSQLEKVDGITDNVSDASANVSAMTSLVASTVGQPIIKVAAFSSGVRRAFSPEAARVRREETRRMRAAAARQAAQAEATAGGTRQEPAPQQHTSQPHTREHPEEAAPTKWWVGTEWDDEAGSVDTNPDAGPRTTGSGTDSEDSEPAASPAARFEGHNEPGDSRGHGNDDVIDAEFAAHEDGADDHGPAAAGHPETNRQAGGEESR